MTLNNDLSSSDSNFILTGQGNHTSWWRGFKIDADAIGVLKLLTGDEAILPDPVRPTKPTPEEAEPTGKASRSKSAEPTTDPAVLAEKSERLKDRISAYNVDVSEYKLDRDEKHEQVKRCRDADALLARRIDPSLRGGLEHCTTSKEKMDYVNQKCKVNSERAKDIALGGLEKLTLGGCASMSTYLNKRDTFVLDLKDLGTEYHITQQISKTLRGLTKAYENFVDFYQNTLDDPAYKAPTTDAELKTALKSLDSRLLAQESKVKERQGNNSGNSPKDKKKKKDEKDDKSTGQDSKRTIPTCEYCNGKGHVKDKCFHLHPDKAPEGWIVKEKFEAHVTTESDDTATAAASNSTRKKKPKSYVAQAITGDLQELTNLINDAFKPTYFSERDLALHHLNNPSIMDETDLSLFDQQLTLAINTPIYPPHGANADRMLAQLGACLEPFGFRLTDGGYEAEFTLTNGEDINITNVITIRNLSRHPGHRRLQLSAPPGTNIYTTIDPIRLAIKSVGPSYFTVHVNYDFLNFSRLPTLGAAPTLLDRRHSTPTPTQNSTYDSITGWFASAGQMFWGSNGGAEGKE
ncbi:unnamed protein product [Zymoseptoria tritici ST99CH_3D7]|uniref:CCHC-type domain-containing protein n=1 Tax=Zymoseptoria tritici (strain ST99CH_3D7) TaxID=1276538 RepID=A0A1X7S744_ZYMT9|nr:unnamed protein product [Zymoseptoria tritici ST99CH_3D7]